VRLIDEKDERTERGEECDWFGGQHRTERRTSRVSRIAGAFARIAEEFDIEPTVEANGNKPISPLSVAAELPCVSENELQLGRRIPLQSA
jgi:hypothetical protein